MENFDVKLRNYVKLAVRVGVNIQKGQKLLVRCPVDQAYMARLVMEEAYEAGAENVHIQWNDGAAARINFLKAPDSNFGVERSYDKAFIQYMVDEGYNLISIDAEDPEMLKGVDPERITKNMKVARLNSKPLKDKVMANEVQWSIVAVPGAAWARKVFPNAANDEAAIAAMWEAIFAACRIDDNDPVENWKKHLVNLKSKIATLMELDFQKLHFSNSLGTDLTIELPRGHVWIACGEKATTGNEFVANIPTEEVFTAPLNTSTEGIVYASKPLAHMGDLIEDFWVRFEGGRAVEWDAKKNKNLLDKLITEEKNAEYLGEVALVPHSSPISQSGILWFETLYDENASCHIALGAAYPVCLSGTEGKSEDELSAMGLNNCLSHTDFMIGTADMDIVGTKFDGEHVQVFKNGEWSL